MGDESPYPNIGFDPCPGSPESASVMQQHIRTASTSMAQANGLLHRLRSDNSPVWQGAAGDSFRQHLQSTLIEDMTKANISLNKAMTVLRQWGTALTEFKQRAAGLEQEAAQANQWLSDAKTVRRQASENPDFQLANETFDTPERLAEAQRRLDNAQLGLRNARAEVDAAEDALESVRKRARDLHDEWDETSSKAAAELLIAVKFAPNKPGLLGQLDRLSDAVHHVGDWVMDHLDDIHSVLSSVSAISGLIALCTPPPIDVIALGVSLVAGAGALATTLVDPKVRKDLGEVLHGHVAGNWGSVIQLGGDVVGVVPGFGMASKSIKAGSELFAEGAHGFPTIVDIGSEVSRNPGFLLKQVAKVPGIGPALKSAHMLEPGMVKDQGAIADVLNLVKKTAGAGKKTVQAVANGVTGGDD